jgi:hypothetical protein
VFDLMLAVAGAAFDPNAGKPICLIFILEYNRSL